MAKKVTVTIIDDMDGESVADESVSFALDNLDYTIDLNEKNAQKLREALAPWISRATKVNGQRKPVQKSSKGAAKTDKAQLAVIRSWARTQGYDISPRGRVPQHIIDAYHSKES